jgi:hypothetical protein
MRMTGAFVASWLLLTAGFVPGSTVTVASFATADACHEARSWLLKPNRAAECFPSGMGAVSRVTESDQ